MGVFMVKTGKVEYDGHVVIVIDVNMTFCVIISPYIVIIIIIIVVIILSRDVVLVRLTSVWIGIRDFESQSIKDFQSDRLLPLQPPDHLANTSGEWQGGSREEGYYTASV